MHTSKHIIRTHFLKKQRESSTLVRGSQNKGKKAQITEGRAWLAGRIGADDPGPARASEWNHMEPGHRAGRAPTRVAG